VVAPSFYSGPRGRIRRPPSADLRALFAPIFVSSRFLVSFGHSNTLFQSPVAFLRKLEVACSTAPFPTKIGLQMIELPTFPLSGRHYAAYDLFSAWCSFSYHSTFCLLCPPRFCPFFGRSKGIFLSALRFFMSFDPIWFNPGEALLANFLLLQEYWSYAFFLLLHFHPPFFRSLRPLSVVLFFLELLPFPPHSALLSSCSIIPSCLVTFQSPFFFPP